LAIAAVVPVLVFAGAGALSAYRGQQIRLREEVVADARRVSESVDRELAADIDSAGALTASPALDPPQNLSAFQEIARREQARHPLWQTVILLDPSGRRLTNSRNPSNLGAAVDPDSVRPAVEGRRPVIGSIAKGSSKWAIPVRAPVIRGDRVVGVVTIAALPDGIARILAASHLPAGWIATVLDQSGRVIARSRNAALALGQPASAPALQARRERLHGTYDGYTLEHLDTVSAFWLSPTYGWSVHIGIPRASFEAPLRRQLAFTTAGFTFSLLLAALFVSLLLRDLQIRRAEAAAMEQSSRMEALGRLTGGVAHDFNNLLMIIQGNAEILQRRVPGEAAQRPLTAIREATARAAKLTRELLIFARGGQAETTVLDLNATVADFLGSIQQTIGAGVELKTEFDPAAGAVEVDRVQLELAVLNLAVNARDAMSGVGRLTLSTRRTGEFVQLSVADTGEGMSEEVQARMFDPFFTTKPQGVGTGLGLTQVYGFVRHAGGSIEVASKPGRGSTIALRLPTASRPIPVTPPEARTEPAEEPVFGELRILVVDDNADVRQLTATYLRERGAEVIEGASGAEGLTALGQGGFHAVVSDIIMAGDVDGLALAEAVRERWPGMPTLLVSGYSASLTEAGVRGFRVLRKPYDLAGLSRVLGELLAAERTV
jgi:signal transduction histidine kinase